MTAEEFKLWCASRWDIADKPDYHYQIPRDLKLVPWQQLLPVQRHLTVAGIGMVNEAGEANEHVKKILRDGKLDREAFVAEMGDVLHYFMVVLTLLDVSLYEVIGGNIDKLAKRDAAAGKTYGS